MKMALPLSLARLVVPQGMVNGRESGGGAHVRVLSPRCAGKYLDYGSKMSVNGSINVSSQRQSCRPFAGGAGSAPVMGDEQTWARGRGLGPGTGACSVVYIVV